MNEKEFPPFSPVLDEFEFEPSALSLPSDEVSYVEFGRTSARKDSKPAIHKVNRDQTRGPYFYELAPVGRASFDARRWDKQHPEKREERQERYSRTDKGRERYRQYERSERGRDRSAAYRASEKGTIADAKTKEKARQAATQAYLNRPIVAIDSEGRCPLHIIDDNGRSPLQAWKEDSVVSPYLKRDDAGNYFEPHELHLIGAQGFDRPYGTPLADGVRQSAHWLEAPFSGGLSTEACLDWLLSLPEMFNPDDDKYKRPVFVMFAAMYDWTMWLKDIPFPAAYSIVKQRAFKPPCKRLQGYQFWKKWAIQMQPHRRLDIGELRWPDDPYGETHRDHPEYEAPKGKQSKKLQFKRKIRIYDSFRHSPMSFVKTIKPLYERGLIALDVFERIKANKQKRGSFHDESIENVKLYTSDELDALCVFMHMMRDAYWNALGIKLKSFHSPASAAAELLRRIGIRDRGKVRGHSWPVKSIDLEHEQLIAHWAYYGGRFECMYKGFFKNTTFNYDLASAYPYAMQSLPSMRDGRWEREQPDYSIGHCRVDILKRIETSSILSIFKVKFCFKADAQFYPLPYRTRNGPILFPRIGFGYYMRDHLLAAIAWCKKFKEDAANALVIEEANWFHSSDEAESDLKIGRGPFAPVANAFLKRIEFDKNDPGGPEQLAIKLVINSLYGKLAERVYRGSVDGAPIIPPHISPWYAAAITAHTQRELMEAALLKPHNIIQFATDAVHTRTPLKLPRLKSEADIKKGLATKLLGDWTWKEVPGGLMIQSGLAFFLKSDGSIAEVKCRGLPLKDLDAAKRVVDEIFQQWRRPYDPASIVDRKKARAVRVQMPVFMPITSAIVSPRRYKLRGYWGIVSKTIWLDDPGSKRAIGDDERTATGMEMLAEFPLLTSPRENASPETISTFTAPDWVENEEVEANRQKRAVAQYYAMFDEDGNPLPIDDTELLLEDNEYIE